ncbi:MAG: hypothetical protein R3F61_08885 [Myxococcota bacterium]
MSSPLALALVLAAPAALGSDATFAAQKEAVKKKVARQFEHDPRERSHGAGRIPCRIDAVSASLASAIAPLEAEYLGMEVDSGPYRVAWLDLPQMTLTPGPLVRVQLFEAGESTDVSVLVKATNLLTENPFPVAVSLVENLASLCRGDAAALPNDTGPFRSSAMPTLKSGVARGPFAASTGSEPLPGLAVRRYADPDATLELVVDVKGGGGKVPAPRPIARRVRIERDGSVQESRVDGFPVSEVEWLDASRGLVILGDELVRFGSDASVAWRAPAAQGFLLGDTVVVRLPREDKPQLEARSVADGARKWKVRVPADAQLTAVGGSLAMLAEGELGWVDPASGQVGRGTRARGAVGAGDRLVVLTSDGSIQAMAPGGDVRWSTSVGSPVRVSGAGSTVHVLTDASWRRWDADTEAPEVPLPSPARSEPVLGPDGTWACSTRSQVVLVPSGGSPLEVRRPVPATGGADRLTALPEGVLVQDDASVFLVRWDGTVPWSFAGIAGVEWSSGDLRERLRVMHEASQASWWFDEVPPAKVEAMARSVEAQIAAQRAASDRVSVWMGSVAAEASAPAAAEIYSASRSYQRTMSAIQLSQTAVGGGAGAHAAAVQEQQEAADQRGRLRLEDLRRHREEAVQDGFFVQVLRRDARIGVFAVRIADGHWQELWLGPDVPVGQDVLPGPGRPSVTDAGFAMAVVPPDAGQWENADAVGFLPTAQPRWQSYGWGPWQPPESFRGAR